MVVSIVCHAFAFAQQPNLTVERTTEYYIIRYQDVDYGGVWKEIRLPDASGLSVTVNAAIERYDHSSWRYDYTVMNGAASQQRVVSWSMPVASGTQVLTAQSGWRGDIAPRRLILEWSSTPESEIAPHATVTGWALVSDDLPAVRSITLRGVRALDADLVDVPSYVRERIRELELTNGVHLRVVGPAILTQQIWPGSSGPMPIAYILGEAIGLYREPLRDIARRQLLDAARRQIVTLKSQDDYDRQLHGGTGAQILEMMKQATEAVRRQDTKEASAAIRNALGLFPEQVDDQWVRSVYDALGVVLNHVRQRLEQQ